MTREELKMHCEKQINLCSKLNDYKHLEEHQLILSLIEENQELKKQLEKCYCNRTDCGGRIKDSKKYDSLVQIQKTQQKEFVKYLESMLDDEKDIFSVVRVKDVLQKYKEIIEDKAGE